ncbi:hypothetical protein [Streptomyces sp. S-9]|uniref:hypothetical protein n=1 Tax=Streptomyces sp. S-9 TaxID=2806600 RepID=UPI00193BD403
MTGRPLVVIEDDGAGMDPDLLRRILAREVSPTGGIGLSNVDDRLGVEQVRHPQVHLRHLQADPLRRGDRQGRAQARHRLREGPRRRRRELGGEPQRARGQGARRRRDGRLGRRTGIGEADPDPVHPNLGHVPFRRAAQHRSRRPFRDPRPVVPPAQRQESAQPHLLPHHPRPPVRRHSSTLPYQWSETGQPRIRWSKEDDRRDVW